MIDDIFMMIMQYSSTNRISLCETFFKMNYNKKIIRTSRTAYIYEIFLKD